MQPSRAVRVHTHLCRRLARLQCGTGIPVSKLVNAILRDFIEDLGSTQHRIGRTSQRGSWRRR